MVAADAVRPVEVKLKSNKTMNHGNDFRSYDIVTIAVTSRDGLAKQLLENDPTPLRMDSRTLSQPGPPPTFSALNRRIISAGDTNFNTQYVDCVGVGDSAKEASTFDG